MNEMIQQLIVIVLLIEDSINGSVVIGTAAWIASFLLSIYICQLLRRRA